MVVRLAKHKVLIVDDSAETIKILGEAIDDLCEILVAVNGAKALEIVASPNPPDLILLDVLMPEMDGYEVCKKIKANPATYGIPVLFVTSLNELEEEAKGLELGAIDYITKPVNPHIVRARVKNHLDLLRQRDMLEKLCSIDSLTCIPNRRRFDETLEQEWSRSIRSGRPISLLIMDLDSFKAYNDFYGHPAGDECLKLVAQTVHCSMRRPADLAARYGGEEFVILLPETDINGAVGVAGMLQNEIAELDIKHARSQARDHVTVSIGVAGGIPKTGDSQEILLKTADKALYEAKGNGRNQVRARTWDISTQ